MTNSDRGRAWVANQAKLEAITGFAVHPEVFDIVPFGHRLVIVREQERAFSAKCSKCGKRNLTVSPERKCAYCGDTGLVSLELPPQGRDVPNTGWVVSVGPEVDLPNPPRSIQLTGTELLGCKVMFAAYGGYTLGVGDVGETLYEGRYVMVAATEVYGLIGDLPKESPL